MNTLEFLRINETIINHSFEVAIIVGLVVVILFIYDVIRLSFKGNKTAKKEKLGKFLIF